MGLRTHNHKPKLPAPRYRKPPAPCKRRYPLTAELLDEADENGIVVIKREDNGALVAIMPRDVYEQLYVKPKEP